MQSRTAAKKSGNVSPSQVSPVRRQLPNAGANSQHRDKTSTGKSVSKGGDGAVTTIGESVSIFRKESGFLANAHETLLKNQIRGGGITDIKAATTKVGLSVLQTANNKIYDKLRLKIAMKLAENITCLGYGNILNALKYEEVENYIK
jgi:hypothetical protein